MTVRYVVAGAVIRETPDGGRRVLMAQRDSPPDLAGLWELPGGKADDDETLAEALVRELDEELDIVVVAGEPLVERVVLRSGLTLVALWARLVEGDPRPVEHRSLRWVDATGLAELAACADMVPADTAWLPELFDVLHGPESAGPS
ncbi:(deoxy)nucleoside triphosphate pyrophosphohydrolase [Gordonia sp. FQ]|uniref:(deoxy)nucleoside triphosphate pyrophosphohydrolase n=1 Tax=Gordonia sp. FQ TaxID=3446634 RepID=UPI003F8658D0